MRYELRRIELWPVAKIVFILSLLLGIFIGVLYGGFFALIAAASPSDEMLPYGPELSIGVLGLVILFFCSTVIPVIYTIFSVIFVGLYNLIAAWIGGFRVEFNKLEELPPNNIPPEG